MDTKRFDELWEKAEAEGYASRLVAEYPAWRTRRRRTMGLAALVLVVVGIGLPLLPTSQQPLPSDGSYLSARCNRADMTDQYWVEMAEELLLNA